MREGNFLERLRSGEPEARDLLMRITLADARLIGQAYAKDQADLDEILAEAYAMGYQSISFVEHSEDLQTWINTMTKEAAVQTDFSGRVSYAAFMADKKGRQAPAVEDLDLSKQVQQDVFRCLLKRLSFGERLTLMLSYSDQLTLPEIASFFHVPQEVIAHTKTGAEKKVQETLRLLNGHQDIRLPENQGMYIFQALLQTLNSTDLSSLPEEEQEETDEAASAVAPLETSPVEEPAPAEAAPEEAAPQSVSETEQGEETAPRQEPAPEAENTAGEPFDAQKMMDTTAALIQQLDEEEEAAEEPAPLPEEESQAARHPVLIAVLVILIVLTMGFACLCLQVAGVIDWMPAPVYEALYHFYLPLLNLLV
jgi:DNA-directed RNA polymerase specialized sigma24 family protein